MALTVGELRDALEDLDDDMEVRLAFQPHWPLQFQADTPQVVSVAVDGSEPEDCPECEGNGCEGCGGTGQVHATDAETVDILYLPEGGQVSDSPYLPGDVIRELGWR